MQEKQGIAEKRFRGSTFLVATSCQNISAKLKPSPQSFHAQTGNCPRPGTYMFHPRSYVSNAELLADTASL